MISDIVVMGISIIAFIFRREFSKSIVSFQNKFLRFNFMDKTEKSTEMLLIVVSIIGFLMGLLPLLGIGKK
jgi:flagellar biosynthesis protein FlhB